MYTTRNVAVAGLFRAPKWRISFNILAALFLSLGAMSFGQAAVISFTGTAGGFPVSGTADFTIDAGADILSVKLTNTTPTTSEAIQLFTGIDFNLGGLTPTLTSDTAVERTVDGSGTFVDGGGAVDISWSVVSLGGSSHQLNFNPNAKHGILGPPDGGSYSSANGSIKGNPGHNPFAAEMAFFELSVPGLEDDTLIDVEVFRFGTALVAGVPSPDPGGDPDVPEPSTLVLLVVSVFGFASCRHRSRPPSGTA